MQEEEREEGLGAREGEEERGYLASKHRRAAVTQLREEDGGGEEVRDGEKQGRGWDYTPGDGQCRTPYRRSAVLLLFAAAAIARAETLGVLKPCTLEPTGLSLWWHGGGGKGGRWCGCSARLQGDECVVDG